MIVGTGKSILKGIAIGKLKIYKPRKTEISPELITDVEAETARYEAARNKAIDRQFVLYEKTLAAAGEEIAEIFRAHAVMLKDVDLNDKVIQIIRRQKHTAEYAVKKAFDTQAKVFADMEDPYFKARSADVLDIEKNVLNLLMGIDPGSMQGSELAILAAEDLAPSELVRLDRSLLLGLITREGGQNSHTAILARSMDIPTLLQCKEIDESWDGKTGIIDGYEDCVYVDPTDELIASLTARKKQDDENIRLLQALKGLDNTTIDGKTIQVYANIGDLSDLSAVQQNDAGGVGLFRSEFIYLNSRYAPSEEEQFKIYKLAVQALAPKPVIIRTCDIGADKKADYMKLDPEGNPALGFRAVRISLTRKDFFKTQLRALLRASAYGNLGIMFPMIISLWEVKECKKILEECRRELEAAEIPTGHVEIGIMIETPAAVLCADTLAVEVDFFSIGTNDLTQFICAIDRQNAKLEPFSDTHHPAVLKAIRMAADAGHRHNIRVGICGELGADLSLTETFLRMDVDELSVDPKSILPLRRQIRSIDLTKDPLEGTIVY